MILRLKKVAGRVGRWLARWSADEVQVSRGLTLDAHPLATEVTLTLDRPRRLRFTLHEAAEFRKRTGISVWTGEGTPGAQGLDIGALTEDQLLELLAVACMAEDPSVTPARLASSIAGEKLMEVVAALMVLIGDFLPEVSEDVAENPLVASALLRLTSEATGRSPLRPWALRSGTTGGSHPA